MMMAKKRAQKRPKTAKSRKPPAKKSAKKKKVRSIKTKSPKKTVGGAMTANLRSSDPHPPYRRTLPDGTVETCVWDPSINDYSCTIA